jgi:hypothetical protein
VKPTPAGLRYYKRCVDAVGQLESASEEVRGFAGLVTGDLRIGLMPTMTRARAGADARAISCRAIPMCGCTSSKLQRPAHRHGAWPTRLDFAVGADLRRVASD